MQFRIRATIFYSILLTSLLVSHAAAQMPSDPCNFKWASVCYTNLQDAELIMRGTSKSHKLLEFEKIVGTDIKYHLPTKPALPSTSWMSEYMWKYTNPVTGPLFDTEAEAAA